MKNKVVKRNKAFLGSIIGAVGSVIGSAIGAAKRRRAEEKAFKMQQEEQYRQDSLAAAQAMTQSYANQDYVDEYKKKVVLKNGGKMKIKKLIIQIELIIKRNMRAVVERKLISVLLSQISLVVIISMILLEELLLVLVL